ncbi:hypothetical protein AVEN_102455-1 [Araneus ventricosus]|uniref:ATP-dependent DNA helicase PIF1 n=1 Tax=Araneus ventricosus TaxID=182803 RepID=A0A4Y2R988_ARAVE|nr:hypothetical protein AVEN_102455-1 [Araneus ventricosus]
MASFLRPKCVDATNPMDSMAGCATLNLKCTYSAIRLAFAMTINKSQGQDIVCMWLRFESPYASFLHGQLYAACSRFWGKPSSLFVLLKTD